MNVVAMNKTEINNIQFGDVLRVKEDYYLVVKGDGNDSIRLVCFSGELVVPYPADQFEKIVNGWSNRELFRREEFNIHLKSR